MKRAIATFALLMCVWACAAIEEGKIYRENIADAVLIIVERHDAYVNNDGTLTDADRGELCVQSARLQLLIEQDNEYINAEEVIDRLTPVLTRHDAYLAADRTISDLQRRAAELNSRALWKLIEESN